MPIEGPLLASGRLPDRNCDADIIILALNRAEETLAAMRSACRQAGLACHVWVLDQGSDDAAKARFKRFANSAPNCAYFETPRNLGVAGGRNFLSARGHAEMIVALDNDAVSEDEHVTARALSHLAAAPQIGALAFRIVLPNGKLDAFSWGYPKNLKPRSRDGFDTTTFVGAGHAIRRTAWEQAGGYDERLFFTWEEYDFCLAAIAKGWRIRYDGSLGVVHHLSPEARIAWNGPRTEYFVHNRLRIARKWGASRPSLLPRTCLYLLRSLRQGGTSATLRGILKACSEDLKTTNRMRADMKRYIHENETTHRGILFKLANGSFLNRSARHDSDATHYRGAGVGAAKAHNQKL